MSITRLTKSQYIPFIDTARDFTFTTNTWKRIDKSTIFDYSVGEKEETKAYIDSEADVTEVTSNAPSLPQEIELLEGNPIYDLIIDMIRERPIGEDCKAPYLLCFGGTGKIANRGVATITEKKLNTVDGKCSFTLKIGGDITNGTYVITSGVPVFTAAT